MAWKVKADSICGKCKWRTQGVHCITEQIPDELVYKNIKTNLMFAFIFDEDECFHMCEVEEGV
jgi:hypothetical protein